MQHTTIQTPKKKRTGSSERMNMYIHIYIYMYYIKIYVEVPSWNMLENPSKPNIDGPCRVERLENLRLYQAQMGVRTSSAWILADLVEQFSDGLGRATWTRRARAALVQGKPKSIFYAICDHILSFAYVCVCEPRYNK